MLKASSESPRMFDSDIVDFFSRTHPAAVPILFVPAIVGLLAHSLVAVGTELLTTAGLFLAGFVVWSLTEYWLHRLFFHWTPQAAWGERMHFLIHGVHHRWPRDKYRLVMPPAVSISLFFLFLVSFRLVVGPSFVWAFHAGFSLGYLTYDMTHYYLHHFTPKTRYGRNLKKHHMLHHFRDDTVHFGVSSWAWDLVFGTTYVTKREGEKS